MPTKDQLLKVRDTIISNITPDTFLTRDEIAEKFKLVRDSTGGSLSMLAKRAILVRRKRGSTNGYEYAAGPRIEFGRRHLGKRFSPKGIRKHAAIAPVPAARPVYELIESKAQLGLIIHLNGKAETLTILDARALYQQLTMLFNTKE